MGDFTQTVPKPLARVAGMPILWHIMKSYAHHGHTDFVLCLGYLGNLIEEYFTDGTVAGEPYGTRLHRDPDWNITFADTGAETLTGGRVHRIRKHVESAERFFLTYGDGVCSVSISELLAFHHRKERLATVTGVHPRTTFGVIRESDGIVEKFEEKPRLEVMINGGFFVLEQGVFDYVEPEGPFERKPLDGLAEAGQLAVFEHSGFWQCMDTTKEMSELNDMWDSGQRPWAPWLSGSSPELEAAPTELKSR